MRTKPQIGVQRIEPVSVGRWRCSAFGILLMPYLIGCSSDGSGADSDTGNGPLAFRQGCGRCHLPPDPRAHRAQEWPQVVMRMQQHMTTQGKVPLTVEQRIEILDFLTTHSAGHAKESS